MDFGKLPDECRRHYTSRGGRRLTTDRNSMTLLNNDFSLAIRTSGGSTDLRGTGSFKAKFYHTQAQAQFVLNPTRKLLHVKSIYPLLYLYWRRGFCEPCTAKTGSGGN